MIRIAVSIVLLGALFSVASAQDDKGKLLKEPPAYVDCTGTVKIALSLNKVLHLQVDVNGTQVQMQVADIPELDSATLKDRLLYIAGKPSSNVEVGGAPRSFPFVRVPMPKLTRLNDRNKAEFLAAGTFRLAGTVRPGTYKVQGDTFTLQLANVTEPILVTGPARVRDKATDGMKKREEIKGAIRLTGKLRVQLDEKNFGRGLLRMEAESVEFAEK